MSPQRAYEEFIETMHYMEQEIMKEIHQEVQDEDDPVEIYKEEIKINESTK